MANYPVPILNNPFFTHYPIVITVRHVRHMVSGEVVKEDANRLPRILKRIVAYRSIPQQFARRAPERNIPLNNQRKVEF